MPDTHTEIEVKIDATDVDIQAFVRWCMSKKPVRYEHVAGPDVYYTQGDNTVRHRWNSGNDGGELTVKRRKSEDSVTDRVEVDLKFGAGTSVIDVTKFLQASGWKRIFTLVKEAHVFWFDKPQPVSVVIYEVDNISEETVGVDRPLRRFIEIEVEKGSSLNTEQALAELARWQEELGYWFDLGETMKLSLYELYSGRRYTMMPEEGENDKAASKRSNPRGRRTGPARSKRRGTRRPSQSSNDRA